MKHDHSFYFPTVSSYLNFSVPDLFPIRIAVYMWVKILDKEHYNHNKVAHVIDEEEITKTLQLHLFERLPQDENEKEIVKRRVEKTVEELKTIQHKPSHNTTITLSWDDSNEDSFEIIYKQEPEEMVQYNDN